MPKTPQPFAPVVATANALRSGAVVFRTATGAWTPDLAEAWVAETAEAAATLLALAETDQAASRVVDAVLIPVRRSGAVVRPLSLRELIRANGPTVGGGSAVPPA